MPLSRVESIKQHGVPAEVPCGPCQQAGNDVPCKYSSKAPKCWFCTEQRHGRDICRELGRRAPGSQYKGDYIDESRLAKQSAGRESVDTASDGRPSESEDVSPQEEQELMQDAARRGRKRSHSMMVEESAIDKPQFVMGPYADHLNAPQPAYYDAPGPYAAGGSPNVARVQQAEQGTRSRHGRSSRGGSVERSVSLKETVQAQAAEIQRLKQRVEQLERNYGLLSEHD